jgi:hyperosmotically inducible periplasmic protein
MKLATATACFALAAFLAPMAAYSEDSDRDSDRAHPMTFVKDSAITTKIKAKLTREDPKSLVNVRVDTDANGVVVLSGHVRSEHDADRAIMLARETEGVTSVKSQIQVKKDD